MTIANTLNLTADLLEKKDGWTQGVSARDKDGLSVMWSSSRAVCFCADGALAHVSGLYRSKHSDYDEANSFLCGYFHDNFKLGYVLWNDSEGRTQDEVVAAFRAAAHEATAVDV